MSLYLSRVVLDPRRRQVQWALADCQALHRAVMAAFPDAADDAARAALGVLYRLEADPGDGPPTLLVQSARPPAWAAAVASLLLAEAGPPAVKPIDALYARLRRGMPLRFRLRANPTKRLPTAPAPDGRRPPGKRVDLRGEEAQLAWLERKGRDHGFALAAATARADGRLPNVRSAPLGRQTGFRPREAGAGAEAGSGSGPAPRPRMTFGAVLFEGELRVTDADRLRAALAAGIGSGKAYGFGLLSVAPAGEG